MPTRNINLTDHYDRFVQEQIDMGRFKNASEVLRAGLRLLEEEIQEDEAKLAVLRRLAAEGFESLDRGEGVTLGSKRELAAFIGELGRRAAERVAPHSGSR